MEQQNFRETMTQTLVRWLYSILLIVVIPFAYIGLLKRGVHKQRHDSRHLLSRFGCVARPAKLNGYLFHCVSVGEVVAASCVIKRLLIEEPDTPITITTTTPTGSARVRAIFGNDVHHFYLPFDLPVSMRWMLLRVRPKAVCITEVELWPNLIHAAWKMRIPVMVVNARMTDRSAKRYKKVSALFAPMLGKLSCVCAQGQRDFDNYLALGIAHASIVLTNNIKFDQASSLNTRNTDFMSINTATRFVIVAGSTHDPEEGVLLDAFQQLQASSTALPLLILVPRHPERFDTVAELLAYREIPFVRTSKAQCLTAQTSVILLDEMGKLNQAYGIADVAFVGGSLADKGGHNALEPAAFGVPILMGPHTYNNPVICEYLTHSGALKIVYDASQISRTIQAWLDEPETAKNIGLYGKNVLIENSGALGKTLDSLKRILRQTRPE